MAAWPASARSFAGWTPLNATVNFLADAEDTGSRAERQLEAPRQSLSEPTRAWLADFAAWAKAQAPEGGPAGYLAVRYQPPTDAFFKGLDPVALIAGMPGVIAWRTLARTAWPPLEDMQPFDCNLVIEALCSGPREAIDRALQAVRGDVEIGEIAAMAGPSDAVAQLYRGAGSICPRVSSCRGICRRGRLGRPDRCEYPARARQIRRRSRD